MNTSLIELLAKEYQSILDRFPSAEAQQLFLEQVDMDQRIKQRLRRKAAKRKKRSYGQRAQTARA